MTAVKPQISKPSSESFLDDFGSDTEREKKQQNTIPTIHIQGHKVSTKQAGKPSDTKDECDLDDDSTFVIAE